MTDLTDPSKERRGACIIVCAGKGHARAAKGLIGRAIRKALSVRAWCTAPHMVSYVSRAELRGYGDVWDVDPRFTLDVTDEECARVCEAIKALAAAEGWSIAPFECYHD